MRANATVGPAGPNPISYAVAEPNLPKSSLSGSTSSGGFDTAEERRFAKSGIVSGFRRSETSRYASDEPFQECFTNYFEHAQF